MKGFYENNFSNSLNYSMLFVLHLDFRWKTTKQPIALPLLGFMNSAAIITVLLLCTLFVFVATKATGAKILAKTTMRKEQYMPGLLAAKPRAAKLLAALKASGAMKQGVKAAAWNKHKSMRLSSILEHGKVSQTFQESAAFQVSQKGYQSKRWSLI